jgi:hypothetical protein
MALLVVSDLIGDLEEGLAAFAPKASGAPKALE